MHNIKISKATSGIGVCSEFLSERLKKYTMIPPIPIIPAQMAKIKSYDNFLVSRTAFSFSVFMLFFLIIFSTFLSRFPMY